MRIYIAGAWIEQHTRARPAIAAVRKAGLTVAHDWTVPEGDVCMCGHHRGYHTGNDWRGSCCPTADMGTCTCESFNGIGVGSDSTLAREYRLEHSELDLAAVESADFVWHLAPNTPGSAGSWVELGAALMARRMRRASGHGSRSNSPCIVVSGAKNRRSIFTEKADQLFATDAEALEWITNR